MREPGTSTLSDVGALALLTAIGCMLVIVAALLPRVAIHGVCGGISRPAQTISQPGLLTISGTRLPPQSFIHEPAVVGVPAALCEDAHTRNNGRQFLEYAGLFAAGFGVLGLLIFWGKIRQLWRGAVVERPVAGQSRTTGMLLKIVGEPFAYCFGCIASFGLYTGLRARGLSPLQLDADKFDVTYTVIYGLVVLGSAVLAVFGGVALRRGNRHLAASAAELLAEDPRPPVLYLRSFRADKGMAHPTKMSSLRDFLLPYTPIEAGLVEALGAVGPVVALGDPEERLPWVGAARAYVGNDEWQTQVAGWAQSARLIVMLAGETKSFYWEIQHVNAMNSLSKTWILVPRDAARYARFRAAFAEHAQGVDLPAWPRTIKSEGFVVAGIVSFPSGGTPRFTTLPHTAPDTVTEWRDILRSVSSATVRAPG